MMEEERREAGQDPYSSTEGNSSTMWVGYRLLSLAYLGFSTPGHVGAVLCNAWVPVGYE